jgi:threonine aldolase
MLNSKASPLPAANGFRSVTFTTPTPSMLAAMMNASFGDDVYQEDHIITEVQKEVALFMLSGAMSNQFSSDAVQ